jgi:hypothetical protein
VLISKVGGQTTWGLSIAKSRLQIFKIRSDIYECYLQKDNNSNFFYKRQEMYNFLYAMYEET